MYKGFLHTHYLVVSLFLLLYVVKTILLLSDKNELLARFTKATRLFEIIISVLFLVTGIFLMTQVPTITTLLWIKIALVFASIPIAVVGFRKSKKVLAALSLLMITAAFGLGEINHKRAAQADNTNIAANDGKALYQNNCASCHGSDGRLGMAGAKDLSATTLDESGIKEIILHGRGAMPAAQVNDEQAAAISQYVNGSIKGH